MIIGIGTDILQIERLQAGFLGPMNSLFSGSV